MAGQKKIDNRSRPYVACRLRKSYHSLYGWSQKLAFCIWILYNVSMTKLTGHILGSILNIPEPQTDLERQLLAENEYLRKQVSELTKRVTELEVLLAKALKNSSTSSKPPSSDIVKQPKPPSNTVGGKRKRGGQPGHTRAMRSAFSEEEISEVRTYALEACPCCGGAVSLLPEAPERSFR